jgi:hypothetical protein
MRNRLELIYLLLGAAAWIAGVVAIFDVAGRML